MMQIKAQTAASSSDIEVFDRKLIRSRRDRFAADLSEYNFLHNWAAEQIEDRLQDIKRDFPTALFMSPRCDSKLTDKIIKTGGIENAFKMDISAAMAQSYGDTVLQGDEEFLPFKGGSLDAVISFLNLHSINDLPGALIQINRALKADGVFIGSMFGGETLFELREALTHAEMKVKGGLSPRVAPFADKQQMGSLMQRAGYALPVIDSEIITISYDSVFALMKDIRFMGESNAVADRSRSFTPRALIMEAAEYYQQNFSEDNGKIYATFEIIFLIGWAPHESQQQPLRPGSAQHSLASALDTEEIHTGIKTGVKTKD